MITSPYLWNTTKQSTATNTTVQTAGFPMNMSTCPLNLTNINTATYQLSAFNYTERYWLPHSDIRVEMFLVPTKWEIRTAGLLYLVSIKSLSEIRTVSFWKDTKSLSEQRLDLDWDDNQSLFDLSQELGVNMYQLVAFIGLPSNFKLDQHWNDNKSWSDHFLLWPKTNDSGTLHCRFEKRHQILQMRISTIHIIQNSISGVKNSDPLCYEQKLKWVQLLRNPITVNFTHNGRVVFSRALFIAVRKLSARRAFYGGSELIMISNCQCLERKEIFESTIHTRATMEKYDADMCNANEPEAIFTDKVEFEITAVNTEILDANHNKQQCPTISMRATWMISSVHHLQQKLVSSESRVVLLIPRKGNNDRQQNVGEMIVQCLRGQRKFECFSLCTKPSDGYHCLRRRTPESIVLNTNATNTNGKQHSCTTDETTVLCCEILRPFKFECLIVIPNQQMKAITCVAETKLKHFH